MKKTELLKFIEKFKDDEDINSNELIDLNSINVDQFKEMMKNNKEIAGYIHSMMDSKVSTGINTWKQNNLEKLINEEVAKLSNKDKTPEQIALEELQAKFASLEQEKIRAEKKNTYTKILNEKGIDLKTLDFIYAEEEETFNKNLENFNKLIDNRVKAEVEKKLNNNYEPPATTSAATGKITWEQVQQNPELWSQYVKQN